MEQRPIVVFDSGFGGISVLKRLVEQMPNEDYVYYGDSANAPYGVRKREEIQQLTVAAIRRACEVCQPKAIVIACNTATAAAIEQVRACFPDIPVEGILPAIDAACAAGEASTVLALATQSIIVSDAFSQLRKQVDPEEKLIALGAPSIVEYVESGFQDPEKLVKILADQFAPYGKERFVSVVLGCTHFPFAAEEIAQALGHTVTFYDGCRETASRTRQVLEKLGWRSTQERTGSIRMINSIGKQEALNQMWKLFSKDLLY